MSTPYPEGWNEVRGALQRGYRFKDFKEAVAFVNRLAEAAEEANHHLHQLERRHRALVDAHEAGDHRP
jgi:4a-hydroxytetrahydrobiopterin dehydratase